MLEPLEESGRTLPFTRLDVVPGAASALALMFLISYVAEGLRSLTLLRVAAPGSVVALSMLLSSRRRVVAGGCMGVLALRLITAAILGSQPAAMLPALVFGSIAVVLLRKL